MKPLDVLSKVSGVDKKKVREIWEEVKANAKLLKECSRPHEFEPIGERTIGRRERCKKCGGIVSAVQAISYREGLKDAEKKGG